MSDDEYMSQLELQRKAFEAQFGSLESMGFEDKTKIISKEDSDEEDSDNVEKKEDSNDELVSSEEESSDAQSEDESDSEETAETQHQPKVIKFNGPSDTYVPPSKSEQKLLKSGKAPKVTLLEKKLQDLGKDKKNQEEDNDADAESENLKNDLELQRFIKESHLLSAFGSSSSGADLTLQTMDNLEYKDDMVMGKVRSRTLEMRLDNISAINGKNRKLEKVPMKIRKGMVEKHVHRIKKYEENAKEGGIILSKVRKGQFRKIDATYKKDIERRIGQSVKTRDQERTARRTRGLKVNTIGRSTRNGLVISKEEISRINGSSESHGRGTKNRTKGKGKGKRRWTGISRSV